MITNFNTYLNILEKRKLYNTNIFKHELLLSLFQSINENVVNTVERDEVINYINNNELNTTPLEFYNSVNKSKHIEMLTQYSIEELSKMRLFKVPGYNIGYALKDMPDGGIDIVSVHNNEPHINNIGEILMKSAINNGGNYLDHYDIPVLSNLYSKMGFVEYHKEKYNPKFDKEGKFRNKYGELDIIYRKLKTI